MGPIWGRQDPGGPHVDPMNFVIWVFLIGDPTEEHAAVNLFRIQSNGSYMRRQHSAGFVIYNKSNFVAYWFTNRRFISLNRGTTSTKNLSTIVVCGYSSFSLVSVHFDNYNTMCQGIFIGHYMHIRTYVATFMGINLADIDVTICTSMLLQILCLLSKLHLYVRNWLYIFYVNEGNEQFQHGGQTCVDHKSLRAKAKLWTEWTRRFKSR